MELQEVDNYHQLGIHLGVPEAKIKEFERNHPHDAQRCKTEVLTWWLRNAPVCSWRVLAQAVEKVGHKFLADNLRRKGSP